MLRNKQSLLTSKPCHHSSMSEDARVATAEAWTEAMTRTSHFPTSAATFSKAFKSVVSADRAKVSTCDEDEAISEVVSFKMSSRRPKATTRAAPALAKDIQACLPIPLPCRGNIQSVMMIFFFDHFFFLFLLTAPMTIIVFPLELSSGRRGEMAE